MPTVMTFTSLQEDIRRYLERGNVADTTVYEQIPRLINMAERAIARKLKIQGFVNVVTSTLVNGTSVYSKPDRWRSTISMNFGVGAAQNRTPLFPRGYEYIRAYWPDEATKAQPRFYADYDYSHWIVAPTPDVDYPWEILYYEIPALLDDTNQTNWLTDYAPNALLYRCLLDTEPFLKNDERIGTWKGFYDDAISDINVEDLMKIMDRSVSRQGA